MVEGRIDEWVDEMFWGKVFGTKHDLILAICDKELIDKRIKTKKLDIKISKQFYGEKIIEDEETAVRMMKRCTIANLIGKRIVALAEKHGFITKENIISIGGIPHAQFVKL
jgi:hypothetical protein